MRAHLKYASYVARHKWFVFLAGLKTGAPVWRLIIHDYTKFSRAEWTPYVNRFFADVEDKAQFKRAWKHHYEHNPHHWNYWLTYELDPHNWNDTVITAKEMPEPFVREMVADWMGAGRAITGKWDVAVWYAENGEKMVLHRDTRTAVERLLDLPDSV